MARVTIDGQSYDVDRRFGSWQATVRIEARSRSFCRRDVLPRIAAALQAALPYSERQPPANRAQRKRGAES